MNDVPETKAQRLTFAEVRAAREKHLKTLKELTNQLLLDNKNMKDAHSAKWQYSVVENNLVKLAETIRLTNKNLEDDELDSYSAAIVEGEDLLYEKNNSFGLRVFYTVWPMERRSDIVNVLKYSTDYSINYDLHWINVGTVGEHMEVALGNRSPDVLYKYCPEKLNEIQNKVLPLLRNRVGYERTIELLEYLVHSFNTMPHLAASIVLITTIESLVRELCRFVYLNQNPQKTSDDSFNYVRSFQSLERLISQGKWQRDLTIGAVDAYMMAAHIDDPELQKIRQLGDQNKAARRDLLRLSRQTQIALRQNRQARPNGQPLDIIDKLEQMRKAIDQYTNMEGMTVGVNLSVKLEFLLRRYKDDRNQIIHGTYENFNKGWKCLVYLSAIVKVGDLISEYEKRYPAKSA